MSQTICWIWLCPLLPPLQPVTLISSTTMTNMADYATKLMSTKTELATLWTIITLAVEQIKSAIESLPRTSLSNAMEIEAKNPTPKSHSCPSPIDIHDLVTNLNHEIATIVIKTRALFQQQVTSMLTTCTMQLPITWISIWTSVGLPSLVAPYPFSLPNFGRVNYPCYPTGEGNVIQWTYRNVWQTYQDQRRRLKTKK